MDPWARARFFVPAEAVGVVGGHAHGQHGGCGPRCPRATGIARNRADAQPGVRMGSVGAAWSKQKYCYLQGEGKSFRLPFPLRPFFAR